MKKLRKFPHTLNAFILLVSLLTVISFFYISISSKVTAFGLLFGENFSQVQQFFISNSAFPILSSLFVFSMYFIFALAIVDIILNSIMFIPSIQRNAFMAILYKTFLMFYGIILIILAVFGAIFLGFSIFSNGIHNNLSPLLIFAGYLTLIPLIQSMFKVSAYNNFKRYN